MSESMQLSRFGHALGSNKPWRVLECAVDCDGEWRMRIQCVGHADIEDRPRATVSFLTECGHFAEGAVAFAEYTPGMHEVGACGLHSATTIALVLDRKPYRPGEEE